MAKTNITAGESAAFCMAARPEALTAQGYSYGDKLLVFKVLVDGIVKYESKPLKESPSGYVAIDLSFPQDSKILTLSVDALNSNRGDNSVWINPTLLK